MNQQSPGLVVASRPDPSVEEWFFSSEPIPLINTSAYDQLLSDLKRYLDGEVRGMSFLIAGHRGSGKTTLAWQACRALYGLGPSGLPQCRFRPLVIPLNGPKFLPALDERTTRDSLAGHPGQDAGTVGTDGDAQGSAEAPPAPGGAGAEVGQAFAAFAEALKDGAAPPAAKQTPTTSDVERALVEFTVALYGALATEVTRCFRERALTDGSGRRADRLELAAQLEVELDIAPSAEQLREFWRLGGFVGNGVLFSSRRPPGSLPADQGVRELVALSSAADAYRRVSGTFVATTESDATEAGRSSAVSSDVQARSQDLIAPLTALATGGLAGVGVVAGLGQPITGVLVGLIAALGVASVFKLSSSRSRSRTMARATQFERDLTLATLDREVPRLLRRLREAGLAPVFIVDELDKVPLEKRITDLVRDLKTLVAERACFCFLTDRSYYESLQTLELEHPYPREYTYFKRRLFIAAGHRELHEYLTEILGVSDGAEEPSATIENDREILPYCLLHQARMHPIDLDRALARLVGEDGRLAIHGGTVVSTSAYQLDLLVQLTVEMLLDTPEVTSMLERKPESKRLVHDSLYYLSRHWADRGNQDLDLTTIATEEAAVRLEQTEQRAATRVAYNKEFIDDLLTRMESTTDAAPLAEGTEPSQDEVARRRERREKLLGTIPLYERNWLFELVRRQTEMLSEPLAYCRELKSWLIQRHEGQAIQACLRDPKVEVLVSTLPLELDRGPLLRRVGDDAFRWRFDQFGRALGSGRHAWSDRVSVVCELMSELTIQHWDPTGQQQQPDREAMLRALRYPREQWRRHRGNVDIVLEESDAELTAHLDAALGHPDAHLERGEVMATLDTALGFYCVPHTALATFAAWRDQMPLPSFLRLDLESLLTGEALVSAHPTDAKRYQWRFDAAGELRPSASREPAAGAPPDATGAKEVGELAFVRNVVSILQGL